MEKKLILEAVKEARIKGPKRNFKQTFDFSVTFKNIDIKKPEQKIDTYIILPHSRGKKIKICGLVQQLEGISKEAFDFTLRRDEFDKFKKDKKAGKKLAKEYDFFVAQAEIMTVVAEVFGKSFGPVGKMPNPKAGCVVPAGIPDLKPIAQKLQKTVRAVMKNEVAIKVPVGIEDMKDEEVADNIEAVYNTLISILPQKDQNIDKVRLKLSMSPTVIISIKDKVEEVKKGKKK